MSGVSAFFRHCPSCGRRFEIRLVGKKEVDSDKFEENVGRVDAVGYGLKALPTVVQQNVPTIVDVEDFQYTYKCKHCGHEWSEVRETTKSFSAPKGYTGD